MAAKDEKVRYLNNQGEFEEAKVSERLVIDFTAEWCPPCRRIKPVFEKLAEQYPGIVFCKVDVDKNEEVPSKENITSMPTFKFYFEGKCVITMVGASEDKLKENLKKLSECKDGQVIQ